MQGESTPLMAWVPIALAAIGLNACEALEGFFWLWRRGPAAGKVRGDCPLSSERTDLPLPYYRSCDSLLEMSDDLSTAGVRLFKPDVIDAWLIQSVLTGRSHLTPGSYSW
jgi:hypothetical protein